MNNNKEKLPTIVPLSILTTLTVVLWIFFDVYRNFKKESAPTVPQEVVKTFNPTLDKETLKKFSNTIYLDDNEIPQNTLSPATATPTTKSRATSTPIASPTASASATPTTTSSPTP